MRVVLNFGVYLVLLGTSLAQSASEWKIIDERLGRSGLVQPGGVYKVGLPRTDLRVRVGDAELRPALALGGWLAFKRTGDQAMVMGDLVLTEDEVAPVTAKLQAAGLQQTAIHNHVLHETPRVVYMHVSGHGPLAQLATALRGALSVTKLPPAAGSPKPSGLAELNQKRIEEALGSEGKVNGGVLQFSIPRSEKITEDGIAGDFVLTASEVNPVIQVLSHNGIAVTALHSHMLNESPRLFFMHFWANADGVKLAKALHDAVTKTNSAQVVGAKSRDR
jgi:hypothetical protein